MEIVEKSLKKHYKEVDKVPKDAKMGDNYLVLKGCPECGSSTYETVGIAVICSEAMIRGGKCKHFYLAG